MRLRDHLLTTFLVTACCWLSPMNRAQAQSGEAAPLPPGTKITADSLEYLQDRKLMIGTGNVVVNQGADTLSADYMTLQTETQDAYARGNVVYRRGTTVWQGQELKYNLKTRKGDFGEFSSVVPPYFITARESKRISTNEVLLKDVTITTCAGDNPEYMIRAREARLIDGNRIRAKGVTLRYRGVPFFYLPKLARRLDAHDTWFEFVPGYSSRNGLYLLSAYNFRMGRQALGTTHLDYRSNRGWGAGQDFAWKATNDLWSGNFSAYYADDDEPFKDENEEALYKAVEDNQRYRLKLSDFHTLAERDYVITELNYLSDPNVVKDFFDDEYRAETQPENRISLTHRGDRYSAGILLNKRLNDFYENVDRLPEVNFDLQRVRVGESPIYYETENSAAQLEKVFPDSALLDDYDATRVDSRHTFFYPTRQFEFLTLIPRAGYRGTYYSDTFQSNDLVTTTLVTDTNGVTTVTTNRTPVFEAGGSDVRSLYEVGFETSFKAHRTWNDVIVLGQDDGFRHIAEPFANYTYVPEPNLRPFDLPQFDSVDQLDRRNDVRFGVRNKFQTKRRGRVHDLMDFNLFTTYRLDPEPIEEDFADISFDAEFRIWDWLPIDFDGSYDQYNSEFSRFNSQITYLADDQSSASLEYRYQRDVQDQAAVELVLFPNAKWSFQFYQRYDIDNNRLDEHEYFVQRKTDCLGYGIGFRQTDSDYQVWVRLFLLAFPDSNIKLGQ
ncbi:MAG: LPS assembly protein LptD [bacterium]